MIREANYDEKIELAEFVYAHIGMGIIHNYSCAVCREKSAVLDCSSGILQPCWSCQKNQYFILKVNPFYQWILKRLGVMK